MDQLGSQLRKVRQGTGLGVRKVARASEMQASHLSSIERGLVNITVETLFAIARGIGMEPVVLLAHLLDSRLGRLTRRASQLSPDALAALEERWDEVVELLQNGSSGSGCNATRGSH